jgi:hypothetical protein
VIAAQEAAFKITLSGDLTTKFKATEPLAASGLPLAISVLVQFNGGYYGKTLDVQFKTSKGGGSATIKF